MITYEADFRHAEIIVSEMGVSHAKPFATPATKADVDTGSNIELTRGCETAFRSIVASANRIDTDRPDIQFPCKEISSAMAAPKEVDWAKTRRLTKNLKEIFRMVHGHWEAQGTEHVECVHGRKLD